MDRPDAHSDADTVPSVSPAQASDAPPALQALSAAGKRYSPPDRGRPSRGRRRHYGIAIAGALLVGVTLTLAGGLKYRCAATLAATGDATEERLALLRKELLDFSWDQARREPGNQDAGGWDWFVDRPASNALRVGLITTNRTHGLQRVTALAEAFKVRIANEAERLKTTPSEVEDLLAASLDELRSRLDNAEAQVDALLDQLPAGDPTTRREEIRQRWQVLRSDFESSRLTLTQAASEMARLNATPEPTRGTVSVEERRAALAEDDALQQDLSELAVNLAEMKLHLLNVWQASSAALEELATAVEALGSAVAPSPSDDEPALVGDAGIVAGLATTYAEAVHAFQTAWATDSAALRDVTVDAQRATILEMFQRSRRRVTEFLYTAGNQLTDIRLALRSAREDPTDNAKHHVWLSGLVRAFHVLEAAHHRFEFVADAIEPANNFRLDAAIRSARGLHRRTSARMADIDKRLELAALKRAKVRHQDDLAAAQAALSDARGEADRTVSRLVELQDELNLNSDLSEGFLRAMLQAEVASTRRDFTQSEFARTQAQLRTLAEKRIAASNAVGVEVVECAVDESPVNLAERLRTGGLGAAVTLLTILLGQWWSQRRPVSVSADDRQAAPS